MSNLPHILPPITQVSLPEQAPLARFRRALRRDDQRVLDDLLGAAQAPLAVSTRDLPFEMFLLFAMLVEGREVLRLRQQVDPYSDSPWLFPARTPHDG
jgi:hypothetical protein